VPSWVRRGYAVSVNGTPQKLTAVAGKYVTIDRRWRSGDTVDIRMPLSFRAERTIDDVSVQSIFYGPTLLVLQAPAVGSTLETGLINVSLYRHMRLSGEFASGMVPVVGKPLHFTLSGQTFAPLFVADPQAGATQPFHMYVRRHEPAIVFGGVGTGVANTKREDGMTFLDVVWAGAPFADHRHLVAAVERTAAEWLAAGRLTSTERGAVVQSVRRAQRELV
jgi:uncharacterized protein